MFRCASSCESRERDSPSVQTPRSPQTERATGRTHRSGVVVDSGARRLGVEDDVLIEMPMFEPQFEDVLSLECSFLVRYRCLSVSRVCLNLFSRLLITTVLRECATCSITKHGERKRKAPY
jgi:hypothetical protein